MSSLRGFVLVLMSVLIGCGGSERVAVTPEPPPDLMTLLEQVAETGQIDELRDAINTRIEQLESTSEAIANELATDFENLQQLKTPMAIKDQAKKMADKL
jgi:hypothetical protein